MCGRLRWDLLAKIPAGSPAPAVCIFGIGYQDIRTVFGARQRKFVQGNVTLFQARLLQPPVSMAKGNGRLSMYLLQGIGTILKGVGALFQACLLKPTA
eukprot:1158528-Pelagomonas_calceolata.AAC.9